MKTESGQHFWLGLAVVMALGGSPARAQDYSQDLTVFRTAFMERDRAFTAEARAEAERRLAQLEARPPANSDAFEQALAKIVALADNGHSSISPGPESSRNQRIGVRLTPFGDDFYVVRAKVADKDILGARLVAIDGVPIEAVRAEVHQLFGGTPALRDRSASVIFESPAQLFALGLLSDAAEADYTFETATGARISRRLTSEPVGSSRATVRANVFPALRPGEGDAWVTALGAAQAPWALQDPGQPFRWRREASIGGLVVDIRQFLNTPDRTLQSFLTEVDAEIASETPDVLILDLRMNGGGDLTLARDWMQGLAARIPGRIYVLTSPWTFSAAISSLGYLEQSDPQKVVIVGEEVGDRLMFFAEGLPVALPASGMWVRAATERHDYANGCRAFDDCHQWVVRHPIAVRTLAPDMDAPWTIEDYLAGRDPGLGSVLDAERRRRASAGTSQ